MLYVDWMPEICECLNDNYVNNYIIIAMQCHLLSQQNTALTVYLFMAYGHRTKQNKPKQVNDKWYDIVSSRSIQINPTQSNQTIKNKNHRIYYKLNDVANRTGREEKHAITHWQSEYEGIYQNIPIIYAQDMLGICPQNVANIWWYCAHDVPKLRQRYAQNIPRIYPRICPRNIPKIWSNFAQDLPKICPECAQDMPGMCPRYAQNIPKIQKMYVFSYLIDNSRGSQGPRFDWQLTVQRQKHVNATLQQYTTPNFWLHIRIQDHKLPTGWYFLVLSSIF